MFPWLEPGAAGCMRKGNVRGKGQVKAKDSEEHGAQRKRGKARIRVGRDKKYSNLLQ